MVLPHLILPELFIKIAAAVLEKTKNHFNSGTFYPPGEPISPHLLRCSGFAVKDHSFIPCASYLQQPRLVNSQGLPEQFISLYLFEAGGEMSKIRGLISES